MSGVIGNAKIGGFEIEGFRGGSEEWGYEHNLQVDINIDEIAVFASVEIAVLQEGIYIDVFQGEETAASYFVPRELLDELVTMNHLKLGKL